jgi:hypothetical protein
VKNALNDSKERIIYTGEMTKMTKLKDINSSQMTKPNQKKYRKYFSYYLENNKSSDALALANPIVIDSKNRLVDGYCTFMIISEDHQDAECIVVDEDEKLEKVVVGHFVSGIGRGVYTFATRKKDR